VQRGFVVADRHQRLDAVALEFVQDPVVEGQALLVGGLLVPAREDPGPGDGEAEDREAHLGEQGDVLGVAVVKVDADLLEVLVGGTLRGRGLDAVGQDVLDGQALAALVVGAFDLVGGGRPAPQESLGERRGGSPVGSRRHVLLLGLLSIIH
jgi:hypothetical protein